MISRPLSSVSPFSRAKGASGWLRYVNSLAADGLSMSQPTGPDSTGPAGAEGGAFSGPAKGSSGYSSVSVSGGMPGPSPRPVPRSVTGVTLGLLTATRIGEFPLTGDV